MDELSEEDRLTVARARKIQRFMSQPFRVAEVFTGYAGKFVDIKDTVEGFKKILSGEMDDYPESAFYMVGPIAEVYEKAKQITAEIAERKVREATLSQKKKQDEASKADVNSDAKPKQVDAYNALKVKEKEIRQYFAEHPEEDKARKYLVDTFGVKPTVLDVDSPTFPRQILQGFEDELAAMEKAEREAAEKKKAEAAAKSTA